MQTEPFSTPLKIGDNVEVNLPNAGKQYYKVVQRDQVFYKDAHSAIAARDSENYSEITNLNPPPFQLMQIYKIKKNANVQIFMKQPATTNRFGTNRTPEGGPIPTDEELDLWFIQNYPPQVKLSNATPVSVTPTLKWLGYRYTYIILKSKPDVFRSVSVTGVGN